MLFSAERAGRANWTLRLLEEKVVELQIVESASDNTIGRTLKKTFSSPISGSNGCVALHLNVRLRRFAIITAVKHESLGRASLKYAA